MVAEDIHSHMYVDHRETRPLDDIVFYSEWLACGSCAMYPHLPERVMRQFDYIQFVLKHPSEYASPAMTWRDMGAMHHDYLNHLVPDEARSIIAFSD